MALHALQHVSHVPLIGTLPFFRGCLYGWRAGGRARVARVYMYVRVGAGRKNTWCAEP